MKMQIFTLTLLLLTSSYGHTNDSDLLNSIDQMIAVNQIDSALEKVNDLLEKDQTNIGLLTRQTRLITLKGNQSLEKKDKIRFYEESIHMTDEMVKRYPKSANGYLRRAIAKGKLALHKGVFSSRSLVLALKEDTQKVLTLDTSTDYQKALASYILGKAHKKISKKPKFVRAPLGLAWANKSEGEALIASAYKLSPNSINIAYEYAQQLKDTSKKDEAKNVLLKIKSLKIYDPSDVELKKDAQNLLNTLSA